MTTNPLRLESSIPANNIKIIELFNKIRSGQLIVNKSYQRKLVWKKQHKFDFIDTILLNYPFPEVYLAPGSLDQEKLILVDEIVDGQQRLTTIIDYINSTDVFAFPKLPITRFTELNLQQKSDFLNYEVSVRYLKGVNAEQVRDVFQRINRTDYALNSTERLNAQWGESEFVCFCKQLVERDFESASIQHVIAPDTREVFLSFFHGDEDNDSVFTSSDRSRMLAFQYIMTVVATIDLGEYFHRNDRVSQYIQSYNEAFPQASDLEFNLLKIVEFINSLGLSRASRWFNKSNLFSILVELSKIDTTTIDEKKLGTLLTEFDRRASFDEFGLAEEGEKLTDPEKKYLDFAREAVNQKTVREFRGEFIRQLIQQCAK